MSNLKGGKIQFQIGAVLYDAKGNFTYNLGRPKRSAIEGSSEIHGYTEKPQVAFIEGEITDRENLDLAALAEAKDVTVTLTLAIGKVIMLRDAWNASESTGNSEEGNVGVRFEAKRGEEVS